MLCYGKPHTQFGESLKWSNITNFYMCHVYWNISNVSKYLFKGNIFFLEAEKIAQRVEALTPVLMTGLA